MNFNDKYNKAPEIKSGAFRMLVFICLHISLTWRNHVRVLR